MAITKCKECGKEVSNRAKACPHCGVANPAGHRDTIVGLIVVVIAATIALYECSSSNAVDQKQEQAKSAACAQDLQCYGDKYNVAADRYCADGVEKLANFTARWTNRTLEPKFGSFRWLNKDAGTLTYIGDRIEFQNGYGAYQRHMYECDFDPASNTVLDVRAEPGHL